MEQERSGAQFRQDKRPACVPCSPERAQCPARLCHPSAMPAFSSHTAQLLRPGFALLHYPVVYICAFPCCGRRPVLSAPCSGLHLPSLVPRVPCSGQHQLRGPLGCPALARHLQPCARTRFPARSAVPIKKKGRDEDCCY